MPANVALASFAGFVPNIVLVLVVLCLAGLLLANRRWEAQNVLLAAFLLLIGVSYLADALRMATGGLVWLQVDDFTAALGAPLFLAFVTEHPYVRRTRLHRVTIAWLAVAGGVCATLAIAAPPLISETLAAPLAPARLLFLLGVVTVGYTVAWFAAVAALRHAPTEGLARRARWACLAVGVAAVPRLAFVPFDEMGLARPGSGLGGVLAHGAGMLAVVAALALPALAVLRGAQKEPAARRVVAAVAGVAALFIIEHLVVQDLRLNVSHPFAKAFALRWILFSGVLVYAILAHQVIRFPTFARRLLPILGTGITGLVAASVTLTLVPEAAVGAGGAIASAVGVGLAATVPGAWGARTLLARAERAAGADGQGQRRLALYSAAVESALAGGTPERLASARRHLGLSRDEARVVEELVRRSLARPGRTLQRGDEPLPGIVIERPLAGGAQARTFLARRVPGEEAVVVKHLAALPAAARRQVWKELDALRALRHPAIPELVGFAMDPVPCVAYDYVPGRTLAERSREGPLPDRELLPVVRDLLGALGAVHGAGFVHGDVKPANLILDAAGRAHLIDFGLVEAMAPPRATLDGAGAPQPSGTLEYMSPELARRGKPTAASDVFALGMVVHEALTGRPARQLRGLAVYQALGRIEREPVPVEAAPARWRPFLAAALHPDPRQRTALAGLAGLLPERDPGRRAGGRRAAAATP
ncbi:MAG: eukaryotic-like serine/threonine-protein kinase [Thermoplasmata archaeon]|nr:eukaryotic-like serine/threonine-protein kinase [Thermoplasmata archaeon]